MSKLKLPAFSFGAKGSIGKALNFRGRGRLTIDQKRPIPKDRKSPAQLAQRQIFTDAVDAWHALTAEEKEAWRGVCPGKTAYQCFMTSELVYVPPPIPIDIGSDPIHRASWEDPEWTIVNKENPANASGTLHTIKIFAESDIYGLIVGTFYLIDSNTLKCRDSAFIGKVEARIEETFTGLSIAVEAGDYIGCHWTDGILSSGPLEFAGVWRAVGDWTLPGDEEEYRFDNMPAISLYGIGESTP